VAEASFPWKEYKDMAAPPRIAIVFAFAAVYIIWGSTYLGILFAIQSIPPFLMAGVRFVLAGLIMYAIARWQGNPHPDLSTWRNALIIGGCLLLCGNGGVTIAEKWVPTGLAALLVATVPIYIALLGWLTKTAPRPSPLVWFGLIGGFVGVGILVGPAFTGPAGHGHLALGMSILLFGSLMWSVGSLYSRTIEHAKSFVLASGQQMICGGILLTLMGFVLGEQHGFHLHNVTWLSTGAFTYLVLIGALVGYTAYFYLLRHCDPAKVATYAYVNPVVAILLGSAFAGEHPTLRTLIGAAIIIGSVATVITAQHMKAQQVASLACSAFAEADELH
jgi:drug/metabolite transporter (DMT)-like permease